MNTEYVAKLQGILIKSDEARKTMVFVLCILPGSEVQCKIAVSCTICKF